MKSRRPVRSHSSEVCVSPLGKLPDQALQSPFSCQVDNGDVTLEIGRASPAVWQEESRNPGVQLQALVPRTNIHKLPHVGKRFGQRCAALPCDLPQCNVPLVSAARKTKR